MRRMIQGNTESDDGQRIPAGEVEYRRAVADMRSKETKVESDALKLARDKIEFEIKKGAICRIDTAIESFDAFIAPFMDWIEGLPDLAQHLVPSLTPPQYVLFREEAERQLRRMSESRVHLELEPLEDRRAGVREMEAAKKRQYVARREADREARFS